MNQYVGVRDLSKKVVRQYIGVGGVAKRVYKAYVGGPGNIPRLYYKDKYWLNVPTVSGTYTYDGTTQTVSFVGLDTDLMTVSGVTSGTDAGTYNAIISLNDTDNYAWMDETTGPKTVSWTIGKQTLSVPTVTGTYTYTGQSQTANISGYDEDLMTKSGDLSATNAGSYMITFGLVDSANYKWQGTSSSTAYAYWSIAKRTAPNPYWEYNSDTLTVSSLNGNPTRRSILPSMNDSTYPNWYTEMRVDSMTETSGYHIYNSYSFVLRDNSSNSIAYLSVWSRASNTRDAKLERQTLYNSQTQTYRFPDEVKRYNGSGTFTVRIYIDTVNYNWSGWNIYSDEYGYYITKSINWTLPYIS